MGLRAGAHALSLLSVPLNVHVLQALAEEPRSLTDLRRACGSPPQTTMRGHLRALSTAALVERRRQNDFPGSVGYELTPPGRELLDVAGDLRAWLGGAPEGPLELGAPAAKSAIKALVDGWSTGIVHILAARSLSLTELSGLITAVSYPSLERRLGAMRLAGQVEPRPSEGRGTPYAVTRWSRAAVAPLLTAACWERRHLADTTSPLKRVDFEAVFLLALPLVELGAGRSGACRIALEARDSGGELRLTGVSVRVEAGRVVARVKKHAGEAQSSASGTATAWLQAILDRETDQLDLGGDRELARDLVDGLHGALFAARRSTTHSP